MINDQYSPYICGSEVGSNGAAFVGRESILKSIREFLNHPNHNGIWLYGYARIGKSSILKRLELELSKDSTCLPIFYSFESTNISKDYVLSKLIDNINSKLRLNTKNLNELLNYIKSLDKKIIFLFDEFQDSIPNDSSWQDEETFSNYLRNSLLKLDCKHFNFVIATRKYNHDRITRFFTGFPDRALVSLFDENETKKLICLSENKGMQWSKSAIEVVWEETQGHPYLTQCLCNRIWYNQKNQQEDFIVQEENVKQEINPNDIGRISGIAAIWTDLSLSEQVVLLAIAKAMSPNQVNQVVTKSEIEKVLNNYESLQEIKLQREIIPLTESPYIVQNGNTYSFKIKLLARWLRENDENQSELEEIARKVSDLSSGNKAADGNYDAGEDYRLKGKFQKAIESFGRAITEIGETGIHFGALKGLIEIKCQQGQIEEALKEIKFLFEKEKVYGQNLVKLLELNHLSANNKIEFWQGILNIYPDCSLPVCFEQRGNNALQAGKPEEALILYQKANLPDQIAQVWEEQGDEAYQKGDFDKALEFYQKANLSDESVKIRQIWEKQGDEAEQNGDLETALELYNKAEASEKIAEIQQRISLKKQGDELYLKAKKAYHEGKLSQSKKSCQDALDFYQQAKLHKKLAVIRQLINKITFLEGIMAAEDKLIELFNEITTDKNNQVKAIFVTLITGEDSNVILYPDPESETQKDVDIESYGGLIENFTALAKGLDNLGTGPLANELDHLDTGKLEEVTFRFNKGGTSIIRLGKQNPVYLFFVSNGRNLAQMNGIKRRILPKIEKLLKETKDID